MASPTGIAHFNVGWFVGFGEPNMFDCHVGDSTAHFLAQKHSKDVSMTDSLDPASKMELF
jgi:hypothetical protein